MWFELAIPWDFLENDNHSTRILLVTDRPVSSRQTLPVFIEGPCSFYSCV